MEQVPASVLQGLAPGKTTVITERTKYLIEKQGISPSEILVITFTKAASIEMRERFHNAMKGRYAPVTFGTFHAVVFYDPQSCLSLYGRKYFKRRREIYDPA